MNESYLIDARSIGSAAGAVGETASIASHRMRAFKRALSLVVCLLKFQPSSACTAAAIISSDGFIGTSFHPGSTLERDAAATGGALTPVSMATISSGDHPTATKLSNAACLPAA